MKTYIRKMILMCLLFTAVGASAQQNALDKLNLPASDNLVVAYSLRRLSSAATKAIEVRRSSDNTAKDIGFDKDGYLDIGPLEEFVGTGDGFVSKWYDQSGKNMHAEQADQAAQPKIVEAGKVLKENDRPIIYTSETAFLVYGGAQLTAFSGINTASRFSVCKIRGGSSAATLDGLDCDKLNFRAAAASAGIQVDGESQKGRDFQIVSGNRLMTVSAIRQSGNSLLYISGEEWDKNTAELSNFSSTIQGTIGRGCNASGAADGEYAELILFNSVLTESEIKSIAANQYLYYYILGQPNEPNVYDYLKSFPSASYSLRKISSAYTGAAIQVRRSSDNQTKDIGFDIITRELKIKDLLDFTGEGDGYVSIWYDQSGMNRHKTQSTPENQPQIVNKGSVFMKNDKPVIFFPAKTKAGLEGLPEEYLTKGDITVCFNAWSNSSSAVPRRAIQGNKQDWLVGPYNNGNAYRAGDWNLQDISQPWSQTGELFTISQPASGPNTVYRNGVEILKYSNVSKGYPGSISISAAGFADEPFDGYMSELLEFNKKLSAEEIIKVQNGMSNSFGLTARYNNMSALVTTDKHLLAVFSLRLINSDYDGPLVRLATGASFYDVYPDDVSGTLSLNSPISAAKSEYNEAVSRSTDNLLSSILTNSTDASVAIWYDQSGEDRHLSQPDNSYRPVLVKQGELVTQGKNGKVALEFSGQAKTHLTGSEDCLTGYDNGYINVVYATASAAETPNGQYLVSKPQSWHLVTNISAHNGGGYFNMYPEGVLNEKQRVIPFFNPTIEKNSNAGILSVSFNKEGVSVYGNRVDVGRSRVALPPIYGNTNKLQLGGTGIAANNENSFDGLVQELIITGGLTQAEQNTLEVMQSLYYKSAYNTWVGLDESWDDDCNWSFASAPGSTDNVHIPGGSTIWPKIDGIAQSPALIIVEPSAKIYLEGVFTGGIPKVELLADEAGQGIVVNRVGAPLGETGIQKWFTAQKGFRLVSNPFKNTQSLAENSAKSGFIISTSTEELSTEKSAVPTAPSTDVSGAQYFTNNYWKNLVSGTTVAAIPYAVHYEGLSPASLSDKDYGPTSFIYHSKGEMSDGVKVSINAANSTGQFTLAGNPFTAPVRTNALTQGSPYYIFDVTSGANSVARRTESGMWIPRFPSANSITPVLGVVAFKQTEASPVIIVPTSSIEADSPTPEKEENADYLQLDLEKDEEYKDRLYIKLADEYKSAPSDKMDLEKLMNGEVSTYTMTPEKMKLSIDCRQKPLIPIPVFVTSAKEGLYSFRVKHNGLAVASEIYLRDRRLDKVTKLDEGVTYAFSVSDKESKEENRFEIFIMGYTMTGMEAPKKDQGIAVYPIPAKDQMIVYSNQDIETVTIYDLNGRPVLTKEVLGREIKVPVNALPQGLYIIGVQSKEGVQHIKFVKE